MWRGGETERHPGLLATAVLCVVTLTFFAWRLGGAPAAFLYRPGSQVSDLTVTFWPNIHYIQEMWRAHRQIPLWRTLIFSGSPFDADPQSGLWYPPNVVFLLLPAAVGFNLLFVLHVVAAGLGMWVWSRATGTSAGGALLAALAYAFTPKVFAHLGFGHVGLVYAAAYVPWALWAAYRVGRGSWRHAGALGLALGWQFIAHPQLAFYTGLVAGIYGLAVACCSPFSILHSPSSILHSPFSILHLLLGAMLALTVAAVQLLPLMRLAPLSARTAMGFSESAVSSLPLRYLWGLLLADHRGFMDYVLYVGVGVLALALLALPRRQAWFWWVFVCVALVYALGANTPFYGWAFRLLPALAWLRAPSRLWFVAAAALALLVGWGGDRLLEGLSGRGRRTLNRATVALGTLALALVLGYAAAFGKPPVNLVVFGVVTPITAALCMIIARRSLPRRMSVTALTVLVLVDLWMMDATLVDGRSSEAVFAESGLGSYLAQQVDGEPFRVYSPSYSLPRHIAARYGLETADGVDPLYLEEYAAFIEVASGVLRQGYGETVPAMDGDASIATVNRAAVPRASLLGLLNVRYVASEFPLTVEGLREETRFDTTYLYENEQFLPRAFIVGRVEPVDDFAAALEWVQTHDVARAAAVEGGEPLTPLGPPEAGGSSISGEVKAEVVWVRRSPNRLVLDVTLDRPGFLVLSQAWYPEWQVEVDGKPEALYRVDGVLSGIYLESGSHMVAFVYCPPALGWGLGASLVGLMACLALLARRPPPKRWLCHG
ncbi:MAG: YfhO family protein [Chloroflexota bacterium]|nr:YfhO family protein [Chloroflexota bacterium]